MEIFGSSGVRGLVEDRMTPEFVVRVARGAASVWDADRVAIARDTRTTGRAFCDLAAGAVARAGADVDRLGVTPTPAVARYCERAGVPAVLITASHNPPEYNGIKLVGADGIELPVGELERIEDAIEDRAFTSAAWDETGTSRRIETANDDYVEGLLASIDRESIAAADLTVAIDPGNGAGALTSPAFYRRLGCDVVTVHATPDGRFPGRPPEPVPEHLDDLKRLVVAADADLGIAHDGDADRAIFVDETGRYIEGDASLAALADRALGFDDRTVAAVNVSQRLVDVCVDAGAKLELTPIGATHIITRTRELRAAGHDVPIAGEGNGGVFFPDYRLVRDGAYIGAKFLELVADRPASEIVEPFRAYHNVRRNLTYDADDERDAMLAAAEQYAESVTDAELSTIDGYRLDYGDAWVLVRPSGTEPKIRIYAEARDSDRARSLADAVEDAVLDGGR